MSNKRTPKRPEKSDHDSSDGAADPGRRDALGKLGYGVAAAALIAPGLMSVRALVPNALYEAPRRFKAGRPEMLADGPNFLPGQRVYLFKQAQTFYCLSAACTHLGCTVQLVRTGRSRDAQEQVEFHCPCHGSKFRGDGTNYAGPAPRPLDYYKLSLAPDDGQLVVDLSQVADRGWRFTV